MSDCSNIHCPHCGSERLFSSRSSQKVFINHQGARIPLLTVNYCLDHPVIEETATIYSCACSWSSRDE